VTVTTEIKHNHNVTQQVHEGITHTKLYHVGTF